MKNVADLRLTDTSIAYRHVATTSLPKDVHGLFQRLKDIRDGIAIIPRAVKEAVEQRGKDEVRPWSIAEGNIISYPFRELEELEEIWHAATDCQQLAASEAAWNRDVHSCLFRAAFKPYHDVRAYNV